MTQSGDIDDLSARDILIDQFGIDCHDLPSADAGIIYAHIEELRKDTRVRQLIDTKEVELDIDNGQLSVNIKNFPLYEIIIRERVRMIRIPYIRISVA